MARLRFHNKIVTARATLPIVVVLCTMIYVFVMPSRPGLSIGIDSFPGSYAKQWIPEGWVQRVINLLLLGVTGFLLREITIVYSLIRVRSTFQTAIYFLLVLLFPYLYSLQWGNIIAPLFYLFLYVFFRSYQQVTPVRLVFYSLFFIGLISLVFPQILFFLPVVYWGFFSFNVLSLRTFCAGLVGLTFPYWFLLGHAFFYDQMELFYAPFLSLILFAPMDFSSIGLAELLSLGFTLFMFLIGVIHYFSFSYQDKIRTRIFLNFLVTLSLAMILFMVLQPQHIIMIVPLLLPVAALFAGRFFALTTSKGANFLFIILMILFISVFGFNIWKL